jgi:general secretion pathway protein H
VKDRAFTLVELLAVLAIISVLSVLIVPSLASAARGKSVKASAAKLANMAEFARSSAVSRHRPVTLNLDRAQQRAWVSLATTRLPWAEEQQAHREVHVLTAMKIPDGVSARVVRLAGASAGAGAEMIRFAGDGRAEDVLIEFVGGDGERAVVEIAGTTGEIALRRESHQEDDR